MENRSLGNRDNIREDVQDSDIFKDIRITFSTVNNLNEIQSVPLDVDNKVISEEVMEGISKSNVMIKLNIPHSLIDNLSSTQNIFDSASKPSWQKIDEDTTYNRLVEYPIGDGNSLQIKVEICQSNSPITADETEFPSEINETKGQKDDDNIIQSENSNNEEVQLDESKPPNKNPIPCICCKCNEIFQCKEFISGNSTKTSGRESSGLSFREQPIEKVPNKLNYEKGNRNNCLCCPRKDQKLENMSHHSQELSEINNPGSDKEYSDTISSTSEDNLNSQVNKPIKSFLIELHNYHICDIKVVTLEPAKTSITGSQICIEYKNDWDESEVFIERPKSKMKELIIKYIPTIKKVCIPFLKNQIYSKCLATLFPCPPCIFCTGLGSSNVFSTNKDNLKEHPRGFQYKTPNLKGQDKCTECKYFLKLLLIKREARSNNSGTDEFCDCISLNNKIISFHNLVTGGHICKCSSFTCISTDTMQKTEECNRKINPLVDFEHWVKFVGPRSAGYEN